METKGNGVENLYHSRDSKNTALTDEANNFDVLWGAWGQGIEIAFKFRKNTSQHRTLTQSENKNYS